ncbi:MAG: hybrid sensor histidine kinase/response regulator [Bacteroidia bacterium]
MKVVKTLIIEDNTGDLYLHKMRLAAAKEFNFDIIEGTSLEQSRAILDDTSFDLILLDLGLPDSSGLETLKEIVAVAPKSCVVVLTGLESTELGKKSMKCGAQDYLFKNDITDANLEKSISFSLARKNFELELKEINNSKNKLFSIIAHDLRGPLNNFVQLTEILFDNFDDIDRIEIEKLLSQMNHSAVNVNRLLENLLAWSRIQVKSIEYNKKDFSLSKLIADTKELFEETAKSKNIVIEYNCSLNIRINSDEQMIKTILRNLISNALKFSYKFSTVKVCCEQKEDNKIEISVEDQGMGIPKAIKESLFKLGTSVNRKGTASEPSTGLGLILCKEFSQLIGGSLYFESEENKGSIFKVLIPID